MTDLPSGTVAFLFSDIEGSTRLWQQYSHQMPAVYIRHDAIIHAATALHDGAIYKTIGDAFQIAFRSANTALLAAAEAQRLLQAERWPLPEPLRVRMALHVGLVIPTPEADYRAPELIVPGHLLRAMHGEQVVLTQAMRDRTTALPPTLGFRDLGTHHLRGLTVPVGLVQLTGDGLRHDFPPLLTATNRPSNLPCPAGPFSGRSEDLELLQSMLLRDNVRLLTIWGPGDTEKTRLALEAGRLLLPRFEDGAYIVDLAATIESHSLVSTIARVLDVGEVGGQPLIDTLIDHLTGKHLLLILDNLDQVNDPLSPISSMLSRCPSITMMATSREPLHSRWEHSFPLDTLPTPDPVTTHQPD